MSDTTKESGIEFYLPDESDGKRIGICFIDADTFWWDATHSPTCPAHSTDDEDYEAGHRFYVPEQACPE